MDIFLGFIAINKAGTDNLDFPKYIKEAFFILLGGDSRFSCRRGYKGVWEGQIDIATFFP